MTNKTLVSQILALPRITRIFLSGLFALAVTLVTSPVIESIYNEFFYSESTRVVPSLFSAGIGILMYALGYFLIVGTVGEDINARRAARYYVWVGLAAIVLVILWIFSLLISAS